MLLLIGVRVRARVSMDENFLFILEREDSVTK